MQENNIYVIKPEATYHTLWPLHATNDYIGESPLDIIVKVFPLFSTHFCRRVKKMNYV
jgi:hypothetical protein